MNVHHREMAAPASRRPELMGRYRALGERERLVLELRSMVLIGLSRRRFLGLANSVLQRCGEHHREYTGAEIARTTERLERDGLIGRDGKVWPALACAVAREAVAGAGGNALVAACTDTFYPVRGYRRWGGRSDPATGLDPYIALRIAVFANDEQLFTTAYNASYDDFDFPMSPRGLSFDPAPEEDPFELVLEGLDSDPDWLLGRKGAIVDRILNLMLETEWDGDGSRPHTALFTLAGMRLDPREHEAVLMPLMERALWIGEWEWIRERAWPEPDWEPYSWNPGFYKAAISYLEGSDGAADEFRDHLAASRRKLRSRRLRPPGASGYLFVLAMLSRGSADDRRQARDLIGMMRERSRLTGTMGYDALHCILGLLEGRDEEARRELDALLAQHERTGAPPFVSGLLALAQVAAAPERMSRKDREKLVARVSAIRDHAPVPALMIAAALDRINALPEAVRVWRDSMTASGIRDFATVISLSPAWVRRIDGLVRALGAGGARNRSAGHGGRLAWLVDPVTLSVSVVMQRRLKRGGWSTGRVVPVRRFFESDEQLLGMMGREDVFAVHHGAVRDTNRYRDYVLVPDLALPALVGHPAVYHADDRNRRLDLVAGEVELAVSRRDDGYHLGLSHWSDTGRVFLDHEADDRYRVVRMDRSLADIAGLIGRNGLQVPQEGKARVIELARLCDDRMVVVSDVDGIGTPAAPGDPHPVVRLEPTDDNGLRVSLWVQPCGPDGPRLPVGRGPRLVRADSHGAGRHERDLAREEAAAAAVIAACPTLADTGVMTKSHVFDEPETGLDFMLELHAVTEPVTVEWPENTARPHPRVVSTSQVATTVRKDREWFAVSGEVAVDDDLVVDMRELLDALDHAVGRFVPIGKGRLVALTEGLRRQLETLRAASAGHGADGERIHPMSVLALDELLDTAGTGDGGSPWHRFRSRLAAARELDCAVPDGLHARLREYQREGYEWMSRLAHIGAGACLADDMGLGKTVQSLALLLARAEGGPALIVAPTSVCYNWEEEAARFAPGLAMHFLGSMSGRKEIVSRLGPGDVLVVSYGLATRSIAALQSTRWHTLVLDEAQAIKNPQAKRTRAIRELDAGFRVALTGTPIENALEELWSLFSVINPGLLGTIARFRRRFAVAESDRAGRERLAAIVRPFILRRRKSMVLTELPSRTEQVLHVEPDPEERAFLEAVRRQAVERIADLGNDEPGARRIHMLAELTRLRLACCHPRLVQPDSTIPGAKLESAMELIRTLIAEGHKALVFSQFVKHLEVVRAQLDVDGVDYQYLDGSTPPAERRKRVNAFQAGEGELFLISLKAGGTGLNLTAADYVIHLDPWWNPAVEDQASDRAHRIGQQRPVTIYRLAVRNSIEEKVIRLHEEKRELADDILAGTESAAALTEEELMNLIAQA